MSKKFIRWSLVLGILAGFSPLYTQESRQKLLVVPLEISSARPEAAAQLESARLLIFESLFNTVALLPFVESPPAQELRQLDAGRTSPESLAARYQSDYMVYGRLELEGEGPDPRAVIVLRVWSRSAREDIFEKKYITTLDLDIFDTLDRMVIDTIQASFRMVPRFAVVQFRDFKIQGDSYSILANNKLLAKADNPDFTLSLKVLADSEYNFMVIRDRDQAIVRNVFLTLRENGVSEISYQAQAKVRIDKVPGRPGQGYTVLFNGRPVSQGSLITNLDVTREHSLLVTDAENRIIDKQIYKLRDGETKSIRSGTAQADLQFRLFAGGNTYGGLGLDLIFSQRFWLGMEGGYTYYRSAGLSSGIHIIQAHLDLGYPVLDLSGLRIGGGLGAGYYITLPLDQWYLLSSDPAAGFDLRVFAQLDWKMLYGRAGLSYNLAQQTPGAYVALGLRI